MLVKCLVLVLLPSVAYSYITIVVKTGKDEDSASIDFTGKSKDVISDQEKPLFQMTNNTLKDASEKYQGARCTDIYVKPPTPWGDVYLQFGWDEVHTIIRPIRGRIVNVTSQTVTVAKQTYYNGHRNRSTNYTARAMAEVQERVNHTWSGATQLTSADNLRYRVNFGEGSVGGMASLTYESVWGNKTSEFRTVVLGAKTNATVTVRPGEAIQEELTAVKGTMKIEVDYEATLKGYVFCNYRNKVDNHHFYAFDVAHLQEAGNLTTSVNVTETILVQFYINVRTIISNARTRQQLSKTKGGIVIVESDV